MIRCGAIDSPLAYHQGMFLKAHFPNGANHNPAIGVDQAAYASAIAELPVAQVQAFSIDDSGTTEIDDALSVTPIEGGHRVGIHIAAPGLAITKDDPLDQVAIECQQCISLATKLRCCLIRSLSNSHWMRACQDLLYQSM